MSTNASVCQRMSAYEQRTLRMATVIIHKLNTLNTLLNLQAYAKMPIYVADTPDIL